MTKNNTDHPELGKDLGKPRILVAPLDWGLGHATRCIPVIYELMRQGAEVWLAGEGAQEQLLRAEFPALPFLPLKGYRIRYGQSAKGLLRNLFFQIPRILRCIRDEHDWLKKAVATHGFDAIISDNRFGLSHPAVRSVFITHQLRIKSPWSWTENFLQKRNYYFIRKFSECWVPDSESQHNLAGQLSHPDKLPPVPVHYIDHLSRLRRNSQPEQKRHLFISLSGPEPQRTILENKLVNELSHYNGTATVVRGLPGVRNIIPSTNDIHFHNHLTAGEYSNEIQKAEFVISRSGYSTVMDIATLGKKSILIPTPGQPEQEYLAQYLAGQQFALEVPQQKFTLTDALVKAEQFPYRLEASENKQLQDIIRSFLQRINQS